MVCFASLEAIFFSLHFDISEAESVITINVSFTRCTLFSFLEEAVTELMMIPIGPVSWG